MNWLRPLLPNRISGQIAILIAISLIVFHLVLTAWFFLDHHDHASERSPERLATLIELIAAAAAETRPGLVQDVGRHFRALSWPWPALPPTIGLSWIATRTWPASPTVWVRAIVYAASRALRRHRPAPGAQWPSRCPTVNR
jgi:hypothetical protein